MQEKIDMKLTQFQQLKASHHSLGSTLGKIILGLKSIFIICLTLGLSGCLFDQKDIGPALLYSSKNDKRLSKEDYEALKEIVMVEFPKAEDTNGFMKTLSKILNDSQKTILEYAKNYFLQDLYDYANQNKNKFSEKELTTLSQYFFKPFTHLTDEEIQGLVAFFSIYKQDFKKKHGYEPVVVSNEELGTEVVCRIAY